MFKSLILLVIIFLCLPGCAAVFVGAGVAGGYAISKDSIQGDIDKNFDSVYANAVDTISALGIIESKFANPTVAKLKAKIDGGSLDIDIERITQKTVRLRVRSRKNMMPNIELAQKVYTKILERSK